MSNRRIPGSEKDENGIYKPVMAKPDLVKNPESLDDILKAQLAGLARLTKHIVSEITAGNITKDTPNNLATCIKITMDLKAKELQLLDEMSDEQLQDYLNKSNDHI